MSLRERGISAVKWNAVANVVTLGMVGVRSILLARWLPVELFGVYAAALAVVAVTCVFAGFGMGGAFLYHTAETDDIDAAASVHLTLKTLFTLGWLLLMLLVAFLFTDGLMRSALVGLSLARSGFLLAQTPLLIDQRQVDHRRIAMVETTAALASSAVALLLAWRGVGLGSLIAIDAVTAVVHLILFYLIAPVWRAHFGWQRDIARHFLSFGRKHVSAVFLWQLLDRIDDLWTQLYLGPVALGYYSRAYKFATYPSLLLAQPINRVSGGLYAELDDERERLGRAFARTNGLLLQVGFGLAGGLVLVAPALIELVLGARWLPMVPAFRLLLIFTMLEPIKLTVANLFVAVGRPEQVTQARLIQLGVLVAGLVLLGTRWGIAGVALAVDVMLVVGIGLLMRLASSHIRVSLWGLFGRPSLGLALGLLAGFGLQAWLSPTMGAWLSAVIQLLAFGVIYAALVLPAMVQTARRGTP